MISSEVCIVGLKLVKPASSSTASADDSEYISYVLLAFFSLLGKINCYMVKSKISNIFVEKLLNCNIYRQVQTRRQKLL